MSHSASQNGAVRVATSDIEAIVREVLKRLNGAAPSPGLRPHSPIERGIHAEVERAANRDNAAIAIGDKLITLASVAGRLAGASAVSVPRGAVITPAARDYLRENKIAIGYETASGPVSGAARLVMGVAETAFEPAALIARLGKTGVPIEQLARVGLAGVVDELADRTRLGGERALLLTGQHEAALCLANRRGGVRAANVGCYLGVRRARRAIGVNFLVINPQGKSLHEIERAVKEFCAGEAVCPTEYAGKLN